MSSKKKGKASSAAPAAAVSNENKMTPELYELKIKDLNEKIEKQRYHVNVEESKHSVENMYNIIKDKEDVIEFLRLQLMNNEKNVQLTSISEKERDLFGIKNEAALFSSQCAKYKLELDQLMDFKVKKAQVEQKIVELENQLSEKERDYKEMVHDLEKKAIQDKTMLRKEMLTKINQVVASFRDLSDQQMAETTKRTIQENIAVNSQLEKLSNKIVDLISENKTLIDQHRSMKQQLEVALTNENELAKKTQSYRKVIKLIVAKNEDLDAKVQ
ncbi:hypothetical protein ROZALSC1DRAFT_28831, partial [Rozella allomycis CSF55]